jgi:hypothetical protein
VPYHRLDNVRLFLCVESSLWRQCRGESNLKGALVLNSDRLDKDTQLM